MYCRIFDVFRVASSKYRARWAAHFRLSTPSSHDTPFGRLATVVVSLSWRDRDLLTCLDRMWACPPSSHPDSVTLSLCGLIPKMNDHIPGSLRWNISLTNDKFAKTRNFPTKPTINFPFSIPNKQKSISKPIPKNHSTFNQSPSQFSKINKKNRQKTKCHLCH